MASLSLDSVVHAQAIHDDEIDRYAVEYTITPDPGSSTAEVELTLLQDRYLLREMRFTVDPERFGEVRGDGRIESDGDVVVWTPPETGGRLRWVATVAHRRNGDGYDAWLGPDWGLFRAEDIVPRARTRTLRGAAGDTTMVFELPRSWSVVSEYPGRDGRFAVDNPDRRFVQPSGWLVMGQLGVRRDRISGVRVAVAAPEDQGVRRLDILAMLNWTLPELTRLLPDVPTRLTVVSANDPMWRGGLSGPRSLYIHADRPLISENGTSTLVHEVLHSALGLRATDGYDWIVEGLAEYYTLRLLRRSGTLTAARFQRALEMQAKWATEADTLCGPSSSAATTARAVTLFAELDRHIRRVTGRDHSLDGVLRALVASGERVDLGRLAAAVADVAGQNPDMLHIDELPGCRKLTAATHSDLEP